MEVVFLVTHLGQHFKNIFMKVEDLRKYKDSLYSSLSKDLDAFEKNFILISSGMLAFSITFIKDIVKIEDADNLFLLFAGWFLILLADGLMMYAFLSSVNGSNTLWKVADDFIVANDLYDNDTDLTLNQARTIKQNINTSFYQIKNRLKYLRFIAIYSFIIGVLFFGSFVSLNIVKENSKDKKEVLEQEIKISVKEQNTILAIRNNGEKQKSISF